MHLVVWKVQSSQRSHWSVFHTLWLVIVSDSAASVPVKPVSYSKPVSCVQHDWCWQRPLMGQHTVCAVPPDIQYWYYSVLFTHTHTHTQQIEGRVYGAINKLYMFNKICKSSVKVFVLLLLLLLLLLLHIDEMEEECFCFEASEAKHTYWQNDCLMFYSQQLQLSLFCLERPLL